MTVSVAISGAVCLQSAIAIGDCGSPVDKEDRKEDVRERETKRSITMHHQQHYRDK